MKEKDYVVYDVYYCGFLAYVGSGYKNRPKHVRSGQSHNVFLNEVNIRSKMLGEPDVIIKINKCFDKKEDSLAHEKRRIARLKPLFNKLSVGDNIFCVLSKDQKNILKEKDIGLLNVIERLEAIGNHTGVNPNLALTPFGFKCKMGGVRHNMDCFDIASISMFGKCSNLDGYFDYYIDHNGLINIKAFSDTIEKLKNVLGNNSFENNMDCHRNSKKPYMYRDGYDPNYNGATVQKEFQKYFDENTALARKLNTYKGVEIVLCLRVVGDLYEVYCLNNDHVLYSTSNPSDALEFHRGTSLLDYKITTYFGGERFVSEFDLSSCKQI